MPFCQETNKLDWMLHGLRYITQHEDFASVCLNRGVLFTVVVAVVDVRQDSIMGATNMHVSTLVEHAEVICVM